MIQGTQTATRMPRRMAMAAQRMLEDQPSLQESEFAQYSSSSGPNGCPSSEEVVLSSCRLNRSAAADAVEATAEAVLFAAALAADGTEAAEDADGEGASDASLSCC